MPEYRYRAVDESGRVVSGTMEEESALRVSTILREQGLQVSSIDRVSTAVGMPAMTHRITWEDIHLFNEQLRVITRSGLPLAHALKAITLEMQNPAMRAVLEDVQRSLESGKSVGEAFERHAAVLPAAYVQAIVAGDRSGNLPGIIVQLSAYSAQMVRMNNSMVSALAYPAVVVLTGLMVVGFMLAYIVPQFARTFSDFGASLPWLTRAIIDLSTAVRGSSLTIPVLLVLILILVTAFRYLAPRSPALQYMRDKWRIRMIILRRIHFPAAMARFSRTLSLMLRGELPADESLTLAGAASGNVVFARAADKAAELVRQGRPLSGALDDVNVFPPVFCWLVSLAEERGETWTTLEDLAESYESTMEQQGKVVASIIGPACIVLLAGFVGSIIIALYLPIFTLADVISGQ